jgi:hypothetical protein
MRSGVGNNPPEKVCNVLSEKGRKILRAKTLFGSQQTAKKKKIDDLRREKLFRRKLLVSWEMNK